MPGNTTIVKSSRAFLPVFWRYTDFVSGQATPVPMAIPGFPSGMTEISMVREASLVTVGIMLTQALTAGLLRFELTKNGTGLGQTVDIVPASGTRQLWTIQPGVIALAKGDEIGVQWGSSGAMAPSGVIDGVIFFEAQPT